MANYSGSSLSNSKVQWECAGQQGELSIPDGEGLLDIGAFNVDLSQLKKATRLKLTFAPTAHVTAEQLRLLFTTKVSEQQLQELNNISPY